MPKTRRRKSSPVRNGQRVATIPHKNTELAGEVEVSRQTRVRTPQAAGTMSIQSLIMPAMVALGCWGMAFTFGVFSTDPNRLLFAGIAALMALMWSVSFSIRLRKMAHRRQIRHGMK